MDEDKEVENYLNELEKKQQKIIDTTRKVVKVAKIAVIGTLATIGGVIVIAAVAGYIEQKNNPESFEAQMELENQEAQNELKEGAE